MTLQDVFREQILAFHVAIIDDYNRAAGPDQSDAMVLRLRNNALALGRLQMVMLATGRHETSDAVPPRELEPVPPEPAKPPPAEPSSLPMAQPRPDRILAGDALSRFTSRRLEAGESAHEIWQTLQENEPDQPRRNPALPPAGFRSPSG